VWEEPELVLSRYSSALSRLAQFRRADRGQIDLGDTSMVGRIGGSQASPEERRELSWARRVNTCGSTTLAAFRYSQRRTCRCRHVEVPGPPLPTMFTRSALRATRRADRSGRPRWQLRQDLGPRRPGSYRADSSLRHTWPGGPASHSLSCATRRCAASNPGASAGPAARARARSG